MNLLPLKHANPYINQCYEEEEWLTYPLYIHSRPKALRSVNIWCCHQLCKTADKLVSVLPFRFLFLACWSLQGLQTNLCFVKVCVTLDKYTQKLIGQLPFCLSPSSSPSPPFLDIPELHHSLLPLCDVSLLWAGPTSFSLRQKFLHHTIGISTKRKKLWDSSTTFPDKCTAAQHLTSTTTLLKPFIWILQTLKFSMDHNGDDLPTEHWRRQGGRCQGMGGPKASGSASKIEKYMHLSLSLLRKKYTYFFKSL